MKDIQYIGSLITAVIGIFTAIPALYNWTAMRIRSKLRADIEMLKLLREAERQNLVGQAATTGPDKNIADAINDLSAKISCKMLLFRGKEEKDRRDLDWSAIYIGIALLFVAQVWVHYIRIYVDDKLTWGGGGKVNDWQNEFWIVAGMLVVGGVFQILKGFKRRKPLRKLFGLDK